MNFQERKVKMATTTLKQALARIEQNAFDLAACHEAAHAAISQVQGLPVYDYVSINEDGSGVARIRSWFPNSEISASNLKHDGRRQAFRFLCLDLCTAMAGPVIESLLYGVEPLTYRKAENWYVAQVFNELYLDDFGSIIKLLHGWYSLVPNPRIERIFDLCMARTFRLVDKHLGAIEALAEVLVEAQIVGPADTVDILKNAGCDPDRMDPFKHALSDPI
jgi:hypothetical protein